MKKLALFLILVLMLSLALVSCGGCETHTDADYDEVCDVCGEAAPLTPEYLGFEGIYNTTYESDKEEALKAATKIDEIKDMSYDGSYNNLAIFRDYTAEEGETKYAVINVDTAKVVYSLKQEVTTGDNATKITKSANVRSIGYYDGYALIVETAADATDEYSVSYTTTVYSALGTSIASKTSKQSGNSVYGLGNDMFMFDGKVYTVKDDVATFKCDLGFGGVPEYDYATDKYYYVEENYNSISVYDTSFKYLTSYKAPNDADEVQIFVLADGNIGVQLIYELPEDATEYDFVYDKYVEDEYYTHGSGETYYKDTVVQDVKCDLVTLVYNVETKTTTEYDANYIVVYVANGVNSEEFSERIVSEKVVNFAEVYEIADKKVSDDESYVSFANNFKLIGYLAKEVADQDGLAELVANNRFVVSDKAGNEYLLNEKGEVLADISGVRMQGELIMTQNGKLYDLSLNLKLDSANIDYQILRSQNDYAIFYDTYKEGEEVKYDYYLLDSATYTFKKLTLTSAEAATINTYEDYYTYTTVVTENEIDKHYVVYCNVEGTEFFRLCTDTVTTTNDSGTTSVTQSVDGVYTYAGVTFIRVRTITVVDYNYEYSYSYYIVK